MTELRRPRAAARPGAAFRAFRIHARIGAASVLIGALAGCAAHGHPAAAPQTKAAPPSWLAEVTDADRTRLRKWRATFVAAIAKAKIGHAAEIAGAGALLDPDAAMTDPSPPVGDYSCRMIKIGGQTPAVPDYLAYAVQPCSVSSDGQLRLRVTRGTQRPHGRLFAEDRTRMIFLGTMMLGDEAKPIRYGVDSERDMAGNFERIGPKRWRLMLPAPHWQSMLDVMEIVPAQ